MQCLSIEINVTFLQYFLTYLYKQLLLVAYSEPTSRDETLPPSGSPQYLAVSWYDQADDWRWSTNSRSSRNFQPPQGNFAFAFMTNAKKTAKEFLRKVKRLLPGSPTPLSFKLKLNHDAFLEV
jgi:hypothetical protein